MSNQFKVGCVYRQLDGMVVRLRYMPEWRDRETVAQAEATDGSTHFGARRLADGFYPYNKNENYGGHLLPGELVQVNGEWVSPTPTLDKMEAEKGIAHCAPEGYEVWVQHPSMGDPAAANHGAEPTRPALDWNKPTPFDPFKGYVTTSHTQDQQASNNHALQRCADFDGLVMKVNPLKGA